MRTGTRGLALGAWLVVAGTACNPASRLRPAADAAPTPATEPRWEDAIDSHPEILLAFRPSKLVADPLYGSLLRRALELAREHNRVVAATRVLDALEYADEAIVAVQSTTGGDDLDAVTVLLGVRGDIDPARLSGDDGQPLWGPGPSGSVRELVRGNDERGRPLHASLFELPGRTWVVASGPACERARGAFAHPEGRRDPITIAPAALALARFEGRTLVARVPALAPPSPLAPLGHGLRSMAIALSDAAGAPLQASLLYERPEDSAAARAVAVEAIGALRRKRPHGLAWLGDAQVAALAPTSASEVEVDAPLPPDVRGALEHLSEGAGRRAP